ncbi:hypothetical protein SCOR_01810 [Sulfidibacter corallicola]
MAQRQTGSRVSRTRSGSPGEVLDGLAVWAVVQLEDTTQAKPAATADYVGFVPHFWVGGR